MRWAIPVAIWLVPSSALAQCPEASTCVPAEDMEVFVKLLREKRCLQTTRPSFDLDPITILTDAEGRTFVSGDQPRPYTLRMSWCGYRTDALGTVLAVYAKKPDPTWGWRLRAKASLGFLPADALAEEDASKGLDAGLLVEPFFYRWFNANGYVGVRSAGAGVGVDLTRNFGAYGGYAFCWGSQRHTPHLSIYFSFW